MSSFGTRASFLLVTVFFLLVINPDLLLAQNKYGDIGIYSNEFALSFVPDYRPIVGEKIVLRLRTFKPAQKVTVYTDRDKQISMQFKQGYWYGNFVIPEDYKPGGHYFTVWIKYPFKKEPETDNIFSKLLSAARSKANPSKTFWSKNIVWYQMDKNMESVDLEILGSEEADNIVTSEVDYEDEEIPLISGEVVLDNVPSPEVFPFIVKGSKIFSFSSKSIVGSKEGFSPGMTREESLRLNISGKSNGTEVNANLISTSTAGSSQVSLREDKISVLVRNGSTEAYFGDFTADLRETEFSGFSKTLSGIRAQGDYEKWGFSALYSSPKGESKNIRLYGDGTQGPFKLDYAPVVIDSERVYLDGSLQKRGDDYTIDYQAGTVTFIKNLIDQRSILNIYYDYSQNVFPHSTYGLRLYSRPIQNLKIGATYINDSDSSSGAGAEIAPKGHIVVGFDGSFVSQELAINGEAAYSNKNNNLLVAGSEESGKAVKIDLSTQLGPLGINAYAKKVGLNFLPIADPLPKQDVTKYGGGLSFRLGQLFGLQGAYDHDNYLRGGITYLTANKIAKAMLTPERIPSLEYSFYENEESNDPVSGNEIKRRITRHSAESSYRIGIISSTLKVAKEKWDVNFPSHEVTSYNRVNFGVASISLEKFSFASNVELEDRIDPNGLAQNKKTYRLNLSANPGKAIFTAASVERVEDPGMGDRNSLDISCRFQPLDNFRTEGKYTIYSLKEDYATTENVSKQTGSFSIDYQPVKQLRLRYLFKPNFTEILSSNVRSYNNEQQQSEINIFPTQELMLGALLKKASSFNVLNQNYNIKQNSSDLDSKLYTIKMAPFRIFSIELNYLVENGLSTVLATQEPLSFLPSRNYNRQLDATVRTSLSEQFSIDSRFIYIRGLQGSGESVNNTANNSQQDANLKGIWNINDTWSISVSGSYSKYEDKLAITPATYSFAPGFGFIFRRGDKTRVDFDYSRSRSFSGTEIEKTNYSLRGKYAMSDYVNIIFKCDREEHLEYKLIDLSGSVEINL